jgi:hypothetical protein
MGPVAIGPLLEFLKGDAPPEAEACVAITVLGMHRHALAATAVADCLGHPSLEVRVCSAKALGRMNNKTVVPALCDALGDEAWEVRSAAAVALGLLQDARCVPFLGRRLADAAWWVRFNAAEALYRLDADGRAALEAAVAGASDRFAHDISRQVLEEHSAQDARAEAAS